MNKPVVNIKQAEPFLQWLYDKHFNYGGLWFKYWKEDGEKHWEKWLTKYYSKFKDAAK